MQTVISEKEANRKEFWQFEKVAVSFICVQMLLHFYGALVSYGLRDFFLHFVAFSHDLAIISGLVYLFFRVEKSLFINSLSLKKVWEFLLFFLLATLSLYPLMLTEYIGFPINVFDVEIENIPFFVKSFLGIKGVLIFIFAMLSPFFIGRLKFYYAQKHRKAILKAFSALGAIFILLGVFNLPVLEAQPNPFVYSLQNSVVSIFTSSSRVVPELKRPLAAQSGETLNECVFDQLSGERFNHVLILVMETVELRDFRADFLQKKDGFYSKVKESSIFFNNYFTPNLDSFTSLIAMLTTIHVPYRAYHTPEIYAKVNAAPNMVRSFSKNGWKTMFVCTAENQPFIPVKKDWDKIIEGRDFKNKENYISLKHNPIESGIEDRIAIPAIVDFMKQNPQTLVMQEMIFGHSNRWTDLTGKRQLDYYDECFSQLLERLRIAGLLDNTLLVILADHGKRRDAASLDSYNIPLLIVGEGIKSATNESMYSHISLQDIIYSQMMEKELPDSLSEVLHVGPSGRWVYGKTSKNGESLFLDAKDGRILRSNGNLSPIAVYDQFQQEINDFSRFQ